MKMICWNSFVEEKPRTYPLYDAHVTLHKPFLSYWNKLNLKAYELQPAVIKEWNFQNNNRPIDIMFYGQYQNGIFSMRNKLIDKLVAYKINSSLNIQIYLQYSKVRSLLFKLPKIKISKTVYPTKIIRKHTKSSIYGKELYKTLRSSKVVINAYGNFNTEFKSNMRVFEAMGNGALLISEMGNYPAGLIPDEDFLTYASFRELIEKLEKSLENWNVYQDLAARSAKKIHKIFSKQNQWEQFQNIVNSL
jgi:spore maturation protein CgeB